MTADLVERTMREITATVITDKFEKLNQLPVIDLPFSV
ncbi:MAG: hypothetical protein OFPI_26130 [Osedax symbiont Rs2]|nr:MAG: hypothetical protein OFPI_26130 [Osedax symbiont Rs2]